MLWRVRIGHLKSQLRYSNSIMSKFAPPVPYSDEKHGRYLERAKSELTEKDKAGKTPEEIIQLEKEMAIYIRNQEIQKVEIKRAQEDLGSMATITQGAGQKQQWFPYYQRQLLDRMEYITENQPKRPVAENKSSSLYPYKFYGEMTEWKGLDDQLNICRTNFGIKSARYFVYEHRVGKQYFERNNQVQRARMLRNQYLSGERLVSLMPAPMQPYLRLARYDKPIGYQLLFVPAFMGLVSGCQFTQLPDAYLMSIFAAGTLLTRGAGCTINDIWDHKLDAQVERCKTRPIPSGAVSVEKAKLFFVAQLTAAFGLLCLLNPTTFFLGLLAPIPIVVYPLIKRYNLPDQWQHSRASWLLRPQLFLGLTFNWGAMMGYSAVTDNIDLAVQIPLYLGCVAWTVMYDTVYALQDIDDDRKLGLNTSADFRQLPKEYRANPAKAFRNHRTRQKIMHYQSQEQSKFLVSCQSAMFLSLVCWATALETRGTIIAADSLVIFTGALMAANYAWYHYGCGAFAGQTADKVKYLEFFKRQKWIGFWLMFSLLIAHGLVRNLRLYDDDLNRVYLLKEESREILTAIQPLLPSSLD